MIRIRRKAGGYYYLNAVAVIYAVVAACLLNVALDGGFGDFLLILAAVLLTGALGNTWSDS